MDLDLQPNFDELSYKIIEIKARSHLPRRMLPPEENNTLRRALYDAVVCNIELHR